MHGLAIFERSKMKHSYAVKFCEEKNDLWRVIARKERENTKKVRLDAMFSQQNKLLRIT